MFTDPVVFDGQLFRDPIGALCRVIHNDRNLEGQERIYFASMDGEMHGEWSTEEFLRVFEPVETKRAS